MENKEKNTKEKILEEALKIVCTEWLYGNVYE